MKTILIIDDEESICGSLEILFKRKGFNVLTASDGKKGITLLNENQVDLVITDIIMPEKDGFETIIEIKKVSLEIPIIAISGGGSLMPDFYLETAKQLGAKYVFCKPFNQDDLLATVYEVLKDNET
jgi:YesN/AraC family two-component response regulator